MLQEIAEKDVVKIMDCIIANFKDKENKINSLNVFPVPDGDTGTNMLLTLKSIQAEIQSLDSYSIRNISDRVSYGALMGARGNSGVILSQILKGFFDIIIKENNFTLDSIKSALKSSMDLAYNSVQNPTEGTMLTTIKDIYKTVENLDGSNISLKELLQLLSDETEKSVLRTTFLLPVLKQAGVVDAGAQGLFEILAGIKNALNNMDISGNCNPGNNNAEGTEKIKNQRKNKKTHSKIGSRESEVEETIAYEVKGKAGQGLEGKDTYNLKKLDLISEIKHVYCTELMIEGDSINISRLRDDIGSLGDSALVVGNERMVKVHVHTNHPHKVIRRVLREGTMHDIQINNMVDQSKQAISVETMEQIDVRTKEFGLIAIANGDGFEEIFKSIGIDIVIKGGQSMNPSTYEIVKAINKIEADKIIILPNNKNIILTANQAKKIAKKNISVIPTLNLPQGITSALTFNLDLSLEENFENMNKAIEGTKVGEVTIAVRDANLYVGEIKKGEYIGLGNGRVKVVSDNMEDAVVDLVRDMASGKEEVITLYYGAGISVDNNKIIESKIKSNFPAMEIEFHYGGQPLYPYIFAIE